MESTIILDQYQKVHFEISF